MTTAIVYTLLVLVARPFMLHVEEPRLKVGAVYCISKSAIEEHMKAVSDADTDRVYDLLWKRKLCDYTQAVVDVHVIEESSAAKWVKVKLQRADGQWRKGSKVTLPEDLSIYVRRSELLR